MKYLIIALFILAAFGVYGYYSKPDTTADDIGRSREINSFITCKVAGYPIMESYPEQCRTPEGLVFVNYEMCIQVITPARNPSTGEIREFPTPCDVPQGWETQ